MYVSSTFGQVKVWYSSHRQREGLFVWQPFVLWKAADATCSVDAEVASCPVQAEVSCLISSRSL
jgi:hypothetical protein